MNTFFTPPPAALSRSTTSHSQWPSQTRPPRDPGDGKTIPDRRCRRSQRAFRAQGRSHRRRSHADQVMPAHAPKMPGKLVEGDHVLPPHFFCGKVSALQDFLESNFSRAESEVSCPQTSLRLTTRSHAHSASSLLRAFHSSPRTRSEERRVGKAFRSRGPPSH